jgi:GT2 family glycosyltransferase
MFDFSNVDELRSFGAPVVRLFRVALGHDPDTNALAEYAGMLAGGASLAALAQRLLGSGGAPADTQTAEIFCARAGVEREAFPIGAMSTADYLVKLVESAQARSQIDVLRGLVPDALPDDPVAYQLWVAEYDSPTDESLARVVATEGPRISLALVVGDSQIDRLDRSLASLRAQIYRNWEAVIALRLYSPWPHRRVADLAAQDSRIRVLDVGGRVPTGAGLARAMMQSLGVFRGMLGCGDELGRTALYEVAEAVAAHPGVLMVYTDEDQMGADGRSLPRFKPGYSPEAMHAGNMLGDLTLYHQSLLKEFISPCEIESLVTADTLAERAASHAGPAAVQHVPAILYHRARAAVHADASLTGASPAAGETAAGGGSATPPSVTVIVPTRDRHDLLAVCAAGVLERTDYQPLELLIIDNGSTDPATLALLETLQGDQRVRVLRQPGAFNFAALCNRAALAAHGDMLLLLNNDVEVLDPGWLGRLIAHATKPGIGAAGAKLLYPDGTVQHAGILLGPDGAATHVGRHAAGDDPGYLGQLVQTRGLSAVTGACLAVSAAAWREVGGMDERLAVTWNDVDLCLRLGKAGLRVVWTPDAVLLHRESASRGLESEDPAKLARFRAEQALMREIWGSALDDDPFLNPNLVAEESGRLRLGKPRRRRPWQ